MITQAFSSVNKYTNLYSYKPLRELLQKIVSIGGTFQHFVTPH